MENGTNEKGAKATPKPSKQAAIRVRKETRRRVLQELARVNKKDYGRRIKADDYIALSIGKVTPDDLERLQEGSLSNADRLNRDYRNYVNQFGAISKDEYLGKRLRGEIPTAKDRTKDSFSVDKSDEFERDSVAPKGEK